MPLMASVVDHIYPGPSMPISRARHALLGCARSAFTTTYAHHTPSPITLSRPWTPFNDLLRPAVSPQVPDRSLGGTGCLPLRCRIAAALRRIQRRETFEVTSDRNRPQKAVLWTQLPWRWSPGYRVCWGRTAGLRDPADCPVTSNGSDLMCSFACIVWLHGRKAGKFKGGAQKSTSSNSPRIRFFGDLCALVEGSEGPYKVTALKST